MALWALDGASYRAVRCDLTPAALDSRCTDVTASVFVDGILHGHGKRASRSHEGSRPATMDLVVTTRGAMIHGLVVVIQI